MHQLLIRSRLLFPLVILIFYSPASGAGPYISAQKLNQIRSDLIRQDTSSLTEAIETLDPSAEFVNNPFPYALPNGKMSCTNLLAVTIETGNTQTTADLITQYSLPSLRADMGVYQYAGHGNYTCKHTIEYGYFPYDKVIEYRVLPLLQIQTQKDPRGNYRGIYSDFNLWDAEKEGSPWVYWTEGISETYRLSTPDPDRDFYHELNMFLVLRKHSEAASALESLIAAIKPVVRGLSMARWYGAIDAEGVIHPPLESSPYQHTYYYIGWYLGRLPTETLEILGSTFEMEFDLDFKKSLLGILKPGYCTGSVKERIMHFIPDSDYQTYPELLPFKLAAGC